LDLLAELAIAVDYCQGYLLGGKEVTGNFLSLKLSYNELFHCWRTLQIAKRIIALLLGDFFAGS
jgi:hypothetical protein